MQRIRQFKGLLITLLIFYAGICFGDDIHHRSIIIDTDMGLDDARALIWLLKMHDFEIEGIITSDGALDPKDAMIGLKKILEYYDKEEIMISEGLKLNEPDPNFRTNVKNSFSSFSKPDSEFNHKDIRQFYKTLNDSLENHSLIYICLGPLTNFLYATENIKGFTDKIKKVFFAGNDPFSHPKAWNTNRDLKATEKIYDAIDNIYDLRISKDIKDFFNESIIKAAILSENNVSAFIRKLHNLESNTKDIGKHIFLYDELIPLYLQFPDYFYINENKHSKSIVNLEKEFLRSAYMNFLKDGYVLSSRPNVVLNQYPVTISSFRDDIGVNINEIISRHGLEEWKAAILTNEMHRHLGAYSLIGVKMGILAREILEADLDELRVISFSGMKPPISCLSDGLQVSTGASLGRGNIRMILNNESILKAIFIMDDRKIRIELKPDIMKKLDSEIQNLAQQYGYGSHIYFKEVRKLSIQYWVNLNRKHMFEVYNELSGEKIL